MTFDKVKEKYLSSVLSIAVACINYRYCLSYKLDMNIFMDKSIEISSISFGFLLAVLALLLQKDTPALTRIRQNGRFGELINFNKKAVVASAVLAVVALIYVSLKLTTGYTHVFLYKQISVRIVVDCVVWAVFIFQVTEVYLFLDLFYIIIK